MSLAISSSSSSSSAAASSRRRAKIVLMPSLSRVELRDSPARSRPNQPRGSALRRGSGTGAVRGRTAAQPVPECDGSGSTGSKAAAAGSAAQVAGSDGRFGGLGVMRLDRVTAPPAEPAARTLGLRGDGGPVQVPDEPPPRSGGSVSASGVGSFGTLRRQNLMPATPIRCDAARQRQSACAGPSRSRPVLRAAPRRSGPAA